MYVTHSSTDILSMLTKLITHVLASAEKMYIKFIGDARY